MGPFVHRESGSDQYFELPLNRALMVVWVAYFVARMHRMFRLQLQSAQPDPVVVDWFFYHDKFAGDSAQASPAMSFFQTSVSANISNGNIKPGFFKDSDTVEADLFVDNLAGLFNSSWYPEGPDLSSLLSSGFVYYEAPLPAA